MVTPALPFGFGDFDRTEPTAAIRFDRFVVAKRRDVDLFAPQHTEQISPSGRGPILPFISNCDRTHLCHLNCVKLADRLAGAAFGAALLMYVVRLFLLAGDRIVGAGGDTRQTAGTFLFNHGIGDQLATDAGRAFLVADMCEVFVTEIAKCRQQRIRAGLAQTAERADNDHLGELLDLVQILHRSLCLRRL